MGEGPGTGRSVTRATSLQQSPSLAVTTRLTGVGGRRRGKALNYFYSFLGIYNYFT